MLSRFLSTYKIRLVAIFSLMIFTVGLSSGQNLIGYNYREIRNYMKENRVDMTFNRVKNASFSYLKYSDFAETETILFFLTPDSLCSTVRVVFASNMLTDKRKEMDSLYKKTENDKWVDAHGGKQYKISLTKDQWSCTLTYEPEK